MMYASGQTCMAWNDCWEAVEIFLTFEGDLGAVYSLEPRSHG